MDTDLSFGFLTILYLLFLDGTRINVDMVTPSVIHFLLRVIAYGYRDLLSLDPLLRSVLPTVVHSTDNNSPTATNGVTEFMDTLQPFVGGVSMNPSVVSKPNLSTNHRTDSSGNIPPTTATTLLKPKSENNTVINEFDFDVPSSSSNGTTRRPVVRASVTVPETKPEPVQLPSPPSSLILPTTVHGVVQPQDLALYLLARCIRLAEEVDNDDEDIQDIDINNHMSERRLTVESLANTMEKVREAVRTALNGKGLHILVAISGDAARSIREMASPNSQLPPSSMQANRRPALALAARFGIAPRYVQAIARLRLGFQVIEDAAFLSGDNTAIIVQLTLMSDILRKPVEHIKTSLNRNNDASVTLSRCTFISLLLSIVEWTSSLLESRGILTNTTGTSSTGTTNSSTPTAASTSPISTATAASNDGTVNHPVIEVMQGSIRVLINLTNNYSPGCLEVATTVPFAGLDTNDGTATDTNHVVTFDNEAWGLGVIVRVCVMFGSQTQVTKTSPTLKKKTEKRSTSATPGVESASSRKGNHGSPGGHFDILMLALGLLVNCIEYETSARNVLSQIFIDAQACHFSDDQIAQFHAGYYGPLTTNHRKITALSYFAALFVLRYQCLELDNPSVNKDATIESMEEPTNTIDTDGITIASYLVFLITCAILESSAMQETVLALIGRFLQYERKRSIGSVSSSKIAITTATTAISQVLRSFVALQNVIGILTEETIQQVQEVENMLQNISSGKSKGETLSPRKQEIKSRSLLLSPGLSHEENLGNKVETINKPAHVWSWSTVAMLPNESSSDTNSSDEPEKDNASVHTSSLLTSAKSNRTISSQHSSGSQKSTGTERRVSRNSPDTGDRSPPTDIKLSPVQSIANVLTVSSSSVSKVVGIVHSKSPIRSIPNSQTDNNSQNSSVWDVVESFETETKAYSKPVETKTKLNNISLRSVGAKSKNAANDLPVVLATPSSSSSSITPRKISERSKSGSKTSINTSKLDNEEPRSHRKDPPISPDSVLRSSSTTNTKIAHSSIVGQGEEDTDDDFERIRPRSVTKLTMNDTGKISSRTTEKPLSLSSSSSPSSYSSPLTSLPSLPLTARIDNTKSTGVYSSVSSISPGIVKGTYGSKSSSSNRSSSILNGFDTISSIEGNESVNDSEINIPNSGPNSPSVSTATGNNSGLRSSPWIKSFSSNGIRISPALAQIYARTARTGNNMSQTSPERYAEGPLINKSSPSSSSSPVTGIALFGSRYSPSLLSRTPPATTMTGGANNHTTAVESPNRMLVSIATIDRTTNENYNQRLQFDEETNNE